MCFFFFNQKETICWLVDLDEILNIVESAKSADKYHRRKKLNWDVLY